MPELHITGDEAADELTILTFRHAAREQDYWDL